MSMTVEELLILMDHVDVLNSWVRSKSYACGWSGRRVIYHYKQEAICAAANARLIEQIRPIYSVVTCRDCGGSRRYTDSWGYTHPHCRRCSSTGVSRLWFAETTIGGYRWHTPRERTFGWSFPAVSWDGAEEARDWAPNQSDGRDLSLDDALTSMMALETSAFARPRPHITYEGCRFDDFASYRVHIGHANESRCSVCGSTDVRPGWFGSTLGRVEWSAKVCKVCQALHAGGAIWDRLKELGPPRERARTR